MDLTKMLNEDAGAGGGASRQQLQHSVPPSQPTLSATPQTPIQAGPPHAFRDYSHSVHASPNLGNLPPPSPHEYPPSSVHSGHPPGPYASPTGYHAPPGPFSSRLAPPPLHTPGPAHDPRSPGSASISGPSPYRHTPTSSLSGASGSYFPGPNSNQPPPSPQQVHQYGSIGSYPRDNYSNQTGGQAPPPVGIPTLHGSVSYMQGLQPMPQTPPVGTPGGSNHPYFQQQHQHHQRSQSLQSTSTSTPTSAHAQHYPPGSHGTPYANQVMESPGAIAQQPSHFQRQSSQPPTTPLRPPLSTTPRQNSAALPAFTQPSSPYQKRLSFSASNHTPQQQVQQHHQQTSPQPQPKSIQRVPSSSHSAYDAVSDSHQRSQSQHSSPSRERSLSVSPKTRAPSLPDPTLNSIPLSDMDPHQSTTPAKRKLDDRDLSYEEQLGEGATRRPPPPEMNGHQQQSHVKPETTSSPVMPRRRKIRYVEPPVWAQSAKNRQPNASRNYVIKSKTHGGSGLVNGNSHHYNEVTVKSEHLSRHTSPEATHSVGPVHPAPPEVDPSMSDNNYLPWEASIGLIKPLDEISKEIADRLFFSIVTSPHLQEIKSRGAQFEIEAKFGTIIDRDTNYRLSWPVAGGEILLSEDARVAFRSSMTQAQHSALNAWLNNQVKKAHPQSGSNHVPIEYKHRYETDKFYELPASTFFPRLPHVMQQLLPSKSPLKARVSHDQKTGEVIAKIVKARVADIHIFLPSRPVDCRISVNLEWDWDGPLEEIFAAQIRTREKLPERQKNRMSYKHGVYQVDLTQVTQQNSQGQQEQDHELEVELDGGVLIEHGQRMLDRKEHRYPDLVDGLMDNVRMLSRQVPIPQ